jgi:hypothetical protein
MQLRALESVLLDVGGTLWPNAMPLTPELLELRTHALIELLGVEASLARALSMSIDETGRR